MMLITPYNGRSGLYLVAESIDCGGKGTVINTIKDSELNSKKVVLDLRLLWPSDEENKVPVGDRNPLSVIYGTDDVIPEYEKIKKLFAGAGKTIDTIITCEPTWANVGLKIRRKIIHEVKGLDYTAKDAADAYAEDRKELISKLIRPAILDGVDVYCERNFCSSVVYQSSMDNPLSISEILALEGNVYATSNSPHLYIICDISADTAMERKALRKKDDQCKFEVPEFQRRIEGKYRSSPLKGILNSLGSIVVYVNTDKPATQEDTARAAISIVKAFKDLNLKDGEKFNYDIEKDEQKQLKSF